LSVLGGGTRCSQVLRKAKLRGLEAPPATSAAWVLGVAVAAGALLTGFSGCGESEGVASGATVTAYVEASLCRGAKQQLAQEQGRAGDFRVQAVCLPTSSRGHQLNLATVGANARQATQNSTTVGYLEAPNSRRSRFTHPILESASIAWISNSSGKAAMGQLLRAIEAAGSGSLRESVREKLHES
jgi:hypothetical protein